MAKTHATLSPGTNILLIFGWAIAAGIFYFLFNPHASLWMIFLAVPLGAACGVMQHLSILEAAKTFANSASLLEVHRTLKSTTWGKRYRMLRFFSSMTLLVAAFCFSPSLMPNLVIINWLAGYVSLMFVRELVTLRDTFYLQSLTSEQSSSEVG